MSWMKFILWLICIVCPYPWSARQTLPYPRSVICPLPGRKTFKTPPLSFSVNSSFLRISQLPDKNQQNGKQSGLPPFSFKIRTNDIPFHISINCLGLYLSLQNACWIFSRTFILHHPYVGKIVKFMEFTSLENTLVWGNFTPLSKLTPKFLSSHPGLKKITHCPWQHSFENLFLPTAERDRGNYDFLYKNSVTNMKMTWNIRFFIFCMTCNFFECDGFTVL